MITKYNLYKESLLNKEILLKNIKEVRNSKPSLEFDNKYGTNLSQEYKFPFDLSADEVWNIISYDIKYYDKYNKDSKQMILLLNSFTNDYFPYVDFNKIDINEKAQILNGMSSGFNKDDIIWFVIDKMYYYKNNNVNNEIEKFPKQIQDDIHWVLSPKTLNKLKELTLQTNESLLNKIKGPSEEEIYNNLEKMSPGKMLIKSVNMEYMKGIKHAINLGANINELTSTTFELLMHHLYQSNETELLYNCIEKYFIKKVNNKQYYFYSCVYGYFEGVKNALEKYNIKPIWNDGGLYGAIKFNNIDIVIYLLKRFESTQNAYEWENEAKEIAYKLNNRNVLDYIYKNNGHDI